MSVSPDRIRGTWEVQTWAMDALGRRRKIHKRGFETRGVAIEREEEERARNDCGKLTVSEFWEVYKSDVFPALKSSTRAGKD